MLPPPRFPILLQKLPPRITGASLRGVSEASWWVGSSFSHGVRSNQRAPREPTGGEGVPKPAVTSGLSCHCFPQGVGITPNHASAPLDFVAGVTGWRFLTALRRYNFHCCEIRSF